MLTRPLPLAAALCLALTPLAAHAQMEEGAMLDLARSVYGEACYALMPEAAEMFEDPIRRHAVTLPAVDGMDPQTVIVWEMLCDAGAYNLSYVYWTETEYYGLRPLAFAMPVLDFVMERPDDPESPLREVRVVGWTAVDRLVNAAFDPATLTFQHYSKYRGLGDAYEEASWRLTGETAQLLGFEVDGSYDGEITPVTIYPAP